MFTAEVFQNGIILKNGFSAKNIFSIKFSFEFCLEIFSIEFFLIFRQTFSTKNPFTKISTQKHFFRRKILPKLSNLIDFSVTRNFPRIIFANFHKILGETFPSGDFPVHPFTSLAQKIYRNVFMTSSDFICTQFFFLYLLHGRSHAATLSKYIAQRIS